LASPVLVKLVPPVLPTVVYGPPDTVERFTL
jgi:hypothetical protein